MKVPPTSSQTRSFMSNNSFSSHLALEKSLQTNGTGRKEPGLQAILATLKKQNSLFGELLTLPCVDMVRVKWNTNALSLSCTVTSKYYEQLLENPLRSLFINMKVPIENGVAGIPKLEPLSEFLNPTKNFKYSSDGLDELFKREMRSTDKRLLVRWFWVLANFFKIVFPVLNIPF